MLAPGRGARSRDPRRRGRRRPEPRRARPARRAFPPRFRFRAPLQAREVELRRGGRLLGRRFLAGAFWAGASGRRGRCHERCRNTDEQRGERVSDHRSSPRCTLPRRAEQESAPRARTFALPRHSSRNHRGPAVLRPRVLAARPAPPARALSRRNVERAVRLRRGGSQRHRRGHSRRPLSWTRPACGTSFCAVRCARRSRFATVQRSPRPAIDPPHGFLWELPAGLIEPGEQSEDGLRDAAVREIQEELGFEVPRERRLASSVRACSPFRPSSPNGISSSRSRSIRRHAPSRRSTVQRSNMAARSSRCRSTRRSNAVAAATFRTRRRSSPCDAWSSATRAGPDERAARGRRREAHRLPALRRGRERSARKTAAPAARARGRQLARRAPRAQANPRRGRASARRAPGCR